MGPSPRPAGKSSSGLWGHLGGDLGFRAWGFGLRAQGLGTRFFFVWGGQGDYVGIAKGLDRDYAGEEARKDNRRGLYRGYRKVLENI